MTGIFEGIQGQDSCKKSCGFSKLMHSQSHCREAVKMYMLPERALHRDKRANVRVTQASVTLLVKRVRYPQESEICSDSTGCSLSGAPSLRNSISTGVSYYAQFCLQRAHGASLALQPRSQPVCLATGAPNSIQVFPKEETPMMSSEHPKF